MGRPGPKWRCCSGPGSCSSCEESRSERERARERERKRKTRTRRERNGNGSSNNYPLESNNLSQIPDAETTIQQFRSIICLTHFTASLFSAFFSISLFSLYPCSPLAALFFRAFRSSRPSVPYIHGPLFCPDITFLFFAAPFLLFLCPESHF